MEGNVEKESNSPHPTVFQLQTKLVISVINVFECPAPGSDVS